MEESKVAIIGGGHNGLVAACYLARAGKKVTLFEKRSTLGGATASVYAFDGVAAKLSRYSYLVALLPDQIINDLGLNFTTLSRTVSSYTPYVNSKGESHGILINRIFDKESQSSIIRAASAEDCASWEDFYNRVAEIAEVLAPTLLQPVRTQSAMKELVRSALGERGIETWNEIIERPLGQTLQKYFSDDLIKGIVFTDGVIGTLASGDEILSNICFLYHLIGNGTGEWKVPLGGMGALVDELSAKARDLGVQIFTDAEVVSLTEEKEGIEIGLKDGTTHSAHVALAACSPSILERIAKIPAPKYREGSQLKINMVLHQLPELKSGDDPKSAFAGTFHINESYSQIESALRQAQAGVIPDVIPAEMYCHTLTDPSILSEELRDKGFHTLTLFAIHIPASLFESDPDRVKEELTRRTLDQLSEYLVKPIEDYIARDANGELCIEVKTPLELERDIDLPRGNIFHGDLRFPWRNDSENYRWGSETLSPKIFLAGAGSLRGGGVSGIGGHNAAMAALEKLQ